MAEAICDCDELPSETDGRAATGARLLPRTCSTTSTTACTSWTVRGAFNSGTGPRRFSRGTRRKRSSGVTVPPRYCSTVTRRAVNCATGHAPCRRRLIRVSPAAGAYSSGTKTGVGSPWMYTSCRCVMRKAGSLAVSKSSATPAQSLRLEDAYKQVRELAHKDPLTGVANRRSLDGLLKDQVATFPRTGIHFSLILCDIDHFKRVNDRWGHPAGDAVLQACRGLPAQRVRRNDLVARFGGEEFMVLMPGSRLEGAEKLAERFRCAITQQAHGCLGGQHISASFGVTEATCNDTLESLLGRVDRALYEAKRLGRNRVVSLAVTGSPLGTEVAVPVSQVSD